MDTPPADTPPSPQNKLPAWIKIAEAGIVGAALAVLSLLESRHIPIGLEILAGGAVGTIAGALLVFRDYRLENPQFGQGNLLGRIFFGGGSASAIAWLLLGLGVVFLLFILVIST